MLKKKTPYSKCSILLVILIVCAFALSVGLFLKSQFSEQPVRAVEVSQTAAETREESVEVSNPLVASEPPQSLTDTTAQTVDMVEIRFTDAQQEDESVLVNICFDLPDDSDWTIWNSTLEIDGQIYRWSEMAPSEILKPPVDGMQQVWTFKSEGGVDIQSVEADENAPAYRCETIYFQGITDPASSNPYSFTIEALEAAPREGEYCSSAYLQKAQAVLDAHQTGITVKCIGEEFISGLEVVTKPETMSMDTAKAYLGSTDFYLDLHGIRGPWVFTFKID